MHMTESKLSYVWISFPVKVHKIATVTPDCAHARIVFHRGGWLQVYKINTFCQWTQPHMKSKQIQKIQAIMNNEVKVTYLKDSDCWNWQSSSPIHPQSSTQMLCPTRMMSGCCECGRSWSCHAGPDRGHLGHLLLGIGWIPPATWHVWAETASSRTQRCGPGWTSACGRQRKAPQG